MRLTTVHQVFIVSVISLGAIYALRSIWMYSREGQVAEILLALAGLAVAAGGVLYLRRFRERLRARAADGGARAPSPAGEAL